MPITEQFIPFSIDFKPPSRVWETILFDASSFQDWVYATRIGKAARDFSFDLGIFRISLKKLPLTEWVQRTPWSSSMVAAPTRLRVFNGSSFGYCRFSDVVNIPVLKDAGTDEVWMSLTPMEVLTCRAGIRKAKGNVLIGGLGLGWMTEEILKRQSVRSVTVVEINEEIARWGRPLYPEAKILVGNVFDHVIDPATGELQYDRVILDVWSSFGAAHDDERFSQLKRRYPGQVWGWGDSSLSRVPDGY